MLRTHCILPLALLSIVCSSGCAADTATQPGLAPAAICLPGSDPAPPWPMYHGPYTTFAPLRSGTALCDDLNQGAKLVWDAKARLGCAKTSSATWDGYIGLLSPPGSASTPILAEGKLYAASFRPVPSTIPTAVQTWFASEKFKPRIDAQRAAIDKLGGIGVFAGVVADDCLVAIDLATGAIAWEAVEAGQGINHPMGKRGGFGVSPAYAGGRVFWMGSSGRIYAHAAASGKKLWQADIGSIHQRREKAKSDGTYDDTMGMESSLVVVDDVVVVPDFIGANHSLIGLDQTTGAVRWTAPETLARQTTPRLFQAEGRSWLLATTANRDQSRLACIDPRDGAVRWTYTQDMTSVWFTLGGDDRVVAVNLRVDPAKVAAAGHAATAASGMARPALLRLSASGAALLWAAPDVPEWWLENRPDCCAFPRCFVAGDRLHYLMHHVGNPGEFALDLLIFSVADGTLLSTIATARKGHPDSFTFGIRPWEDRFLNVPDSAHSHRESFQIQFRSGEDFRTLGKLWIPPVWVTTGYMVPIETPYHAGRFYLRTRHGTVACIDIARR